MAYPPNQFDNARSGFLTPRAYGQGQPIGNIAQLPRRRQGLLNRIGSTLATLGQGTQQFLSNFGGRYVPPGMELTDLQKGELAANVFRSMGRDAQGNRRDETSPFLAQIAQENEFAREQDRRRAEMAAIQGSALSPEDQAMMLALPDQLRGSAMEDYLGAKLGTGSQAGGAGLNEIYFEDMNNNNSLVMGQPMSGANGGFLINGVIYGGRGQPPIPANLRPIDTARMSPELAARLADVETAAEGERLRQANQIEFERLTNPEYLLAESNYMAALEGAKQRAIGDETLDTETRKQQIANLVEIQADLPRAYSRVRDGTRHLNDVNSMVDEALGMTSGWTTGIMSALNDVPGTPQHTLAMQIMKIEANLGFDKLQAMRDASPTGGALGQVSEMELELLKSAVANLKQSNTEEEFRRNLELVKEHNERLWTSVQDDFRIMYGVEYFDPNATETGAEVIQRKISELLGGTDTRGSTNNRVRVDADGNII